MTVPTCPNCGANVVETDDFCGNCGTYLGWLHPDPRTDTDPPATDVGPEPPAATPVEPVAAFDQPGAVAPARPVTRRQRPGVHGTEGPVNGPPCKVCGTANPVGARFCRRCAAPLSAPAATRPQRRRHWLRWPRRDGVGSPWPRRAVVVLVLAALAAAGVLLYPLAGPLVEDVRDKLSTPQEIGPVRVTANAAVPNHPVTAAVDGVTNRYWGAPAVGDSAEFDFAEPFRLVGLIIHTGADTNRQVFEQQARPSALKIEATTSDGTTTTVPVTLADQPGPQRTDTGISDVVTIRVVIQAATDLTPGKHIALGEIEFFRRP